MPTADPCQTERRRPDGVPDRDGAENGEESEGFPKDFDPERTTYPKARRVIRRQPTMKSGGQCTPSAPLFPTPIARDQFPNQPKLETVTWALEAPT